MRRTDGARRGAARLVAVVTLLVGCGPRSTVSTAAGQIGQPTGAATGAETATLPDLATMRRVTTGPRAGQGIDPTRAAIRNPYTNQPAAIAEGEHLYIHMNCAYCHGFDGTGGMGPPLTGGSWRYGGDDVDLFNTLYGGRAKGMPAWGDALSEDDIWKVIAYVRTLAVVGGTAHGTPALAAVTNRQPETGDAGREPVPGTSPMRGEQGKGTNQVSP